MPLNTLVVEDDELTCWGLMKVLSGRNCCVKVVHTAHDAVSEIHRQRYDSVFLDINLPDGNGFAIFEEIKALAPNTKVVIMTGDDSAVNKQKALEEGAYYFIGKPLNLAEIKEIVLSLAGSEELHS